MGGETWVVREAGGVDSGRTEHDTVGGEDPGNMVAGGGKGRAV